MTAYAVVDAADTIVSFHLKRWQADNAADRMNANRMMPRAPYRVEVVDVERRERTEP